MPTGLHILRPTWKILFVLGFQNFICKMMSSFYENSEIVPCPTLYAPGNFGYFATLIDSSSSCESIYWDKCREQFAKKFTENLNGFFYSVYEPNKHGPAAFIKDTEHFLGIKDPSKFYLSNRENVIYIRVSEFWKKCYMRRSLFTLICRLGLIYEGKSWEANLFGFVQETKNSELDANYEMARKTNKALLRFFLGFTKYVGSLDHIQKEYFPEKHGWVMEFSGKSNDQIKQLLILDNTDKCPLNGNYIFGKELILK